MSTIFTGSSKIWPATRSYKYHADRPASHLAPVRLGAAVDLLDPVDAGLGQLPPQVTRRLGELGKDQNRARLQNRVGVQQLDQGLELVVVPGLEVAQLVQEGGNLVEVVERFIQDLGHVILVAVQPVHGLQHLLGDKVLVGLVVRVVGEQLRTFQSSSLLSTMKSALPDLLVRFGIGWLCEDKDLGLV